MNPYAALGLDVSLVLGEACLLFAACWFVARRLDNWSIVDVVWAYGFALIGLQKLGQHLVAGSLDGPGLLTALATVGWSLRLGTHLARRVLGHLDREDGRYLRMRAEHGDRMPRQMIGFYFLQAVALTLLCLPLLTASPAGRPSPLTALHWVGLALVGGAIGLEGVADAQLAAFKRAPGNQGRVCDRGLWAWCRHPNYFGEWLVWVGFLLMSYNASFRGIPGLLCAAVMYYLLNHVTGIPLTEQQLLASKGAAYADYQARVPAFWPRPPRA